MSYFYTKQIDWTYDTLKMAANNLIQAAPPFSGLVQKAAQKTSNKVFQQGTIISGLPQYLQEAYKNNAPLHMLIDSYLDAGLSVDEILTKITEFLFRVYSNKFDEKEEYIEKLAKIVYKEYERGAGKYVLIDKEIIKKCQLNIDKF